MFVEDTISMTSRHVTSRLSGRHEPRQNGFTELLRDDLDSIVIRVFPVRSETPFVTVVVSRYGIQKSLSHVDVRNGVIVANLPIDSHVSVQHPFLRVILAWRMFHNLSSKCATVELNS